MWQSTLVLAIAYLVGGVNFALVLAAWRLIPNPRSRASGNPGVSNVYRIAGPWWAGLVLALDVGRAAAVAVACLWLLPAPVAPWGALALVLGNLYPAFHRFKGGKGVANLLGFTAGLAPLLALAAALTWPLAFGVIRRTHLCSFVMVAALGAVLAHSFAYRPSALLAAATTAALIGWAHRSNVRKALGKQRATGGSSSTGAQ
jgi:glycerol-3-phosphate acyltransferase PlsY